MTTRADNNGPFKAFDFGEWIFDCWKECAEEMKPNRQTVYGEKVQAHMRNAVKEQLVAVRDMLDAAIEEIDRKSAGANKA